MNSPLTSRLATAAPFTSLGRLLRTHDDEQATEALYLKVLARRPRSDEVQLARDHIAEAGSRREAFEDLIWALLNSTEFLHRP